MSLNQFLKVTTLGLTLFASAGHAGVKMNSMCYLAPNAESAQAFNPSKEEIAESGSALLKKIPTNVTAEDVQTAFRIASLSKVFTSHWAVMTLGPEYRFQTKIHVTPGTKKSTCNMHFEGDGDPILGREMLTKVFGELKPQLKAMNCASFETISFDEKFRVLLDVISHQQSSNALKMFGWSNPALYASSRRTTADFKAFIQHRSGLKVDLKNVGEVAKADYDVYRQSVPTRTFAFKSRPLHRILKELNKYSHNYITNVIFDRLGGAAAYSAFIAQRLQLTQEQVHLLNGSGYPVFLEDGSKVYNVATCDALVRVMKDLDAGLIQYKGTRAFNVADVLPVGGPSESYSTFKGAYGSSTFDRTLAAKTGSAEGAITFGGVLSTNLGNLYFGVLTAPDSYSGADVPMARQYIRDLMGVLTERQESLKPMVYAADGAMSAFDRESALVEITAPASSPRLN